MKKKKLIKCDYPGCTSNEAKKIFIKTNWFRGDDVVLNACKEHRQEASQADLLKTERAKRQMA